MPTLLKPILQKVTLTKQTRPISALSKSPTTLRPNLSRHIDLARIQAALLAFGQGLVHVVAQIGHWAWRNLRHQARVANDVMHRRPPRFETNIAMGTFAFIVVAAVAGVLMVGGVRL